MLTNSLFKNRKHNGVFVLLVFFALVLSGFSQNSYTFTNCGATGSVGPTQAQVNLSYSLTNLNGLVGTTTSGIQTWTVPYTGVFRIEARGAQGGTSTSTGGLGATIAGDFSLTVGEVIRILVGQRGEHGVSSISPGGGGGGSYVVRAPYTTTNSILVIAGGGTGGGAYADNPGLITTSGGAGGVAGGANGTGGLGGIRGAGGGGFLTDGAPCSVSTNYADPGQAFINGGRGGNKPNNPTCTSTFGSVICSGGFGGGSSHGGNCFLNGGAGGGYSGGGGSSNTSSGGGGSLNQGTNQTNVAGNNAGFGRVVITELCSVKLYASGSNSLNPLLCSGNSLTLTTDAVSNYSWSTGNTTSSVIVVNPTTTTVYSVQGTSSLSCVSVGYITVTVNSAVPSLTVANTASLASGICPGNSVTITASGANSYSWTGGINNGVSFTPTTAAGYTVTGSNACGTSTAATSVSVHPIPPVVASISQPSVCTGNTVTTLATGAASYTWSHGVPNGQVLYPSATTMYSVTGTSALGCTATAMVGVTVEVTPILAPVATPTVICIGGSGTIAAQGAAVYNWMPGNLNTGTIVITPLTTTTYTLTKSNANCVDVKTITVFVNQLPNVFAITSHTTVCAGSSATLSGGGASSYSWTPSPFNLVGNNVSVSPSAPTVYTCTGSDGTCTATYTVFVGTNPIPTIQPTASTPTLCLGGSVTLNATGALTYTWNPGGQGSQIIETPLAPTNYIVSGTNSFSCVAQAQIPVIVYPNPTVNAIPNRTLVCLNGPSTITASGANTYVWSTGALTHTTLVFPPATTVYTVTGTYTNSGCSSSKTVMVQAYTPVTGINGPTAVCIGSSITISSAPANSYTWSSGGNFISNQASILIGPNINTTYLLGTTSTSNQVSCVGGNSITIQVNPLPIVTASAVANRTLICRDESVDLFANGGLTYSWVNQGSNTNMLTVSPLTQTTYTVLGTDANGCVNSATVTIKISICQGLEEMSSAANQISIFPNPSSGEFKISSNQNMSLVLVNDLGQLIREIDLNESNVYTACIKGIAKGLYFLSTQNKQGQINKKIIVE